MTTRTGTKSRAYTAWQQQRMQDRAREAAQDTPSPATIRRVTDAMLNREWLPQDSQPKRVGEFRGWHVRVYHPSPYDLTRQAVYVCASRPVREDGSPGEELTDEVPDMAAADAWMRATL